jgi:hypothetical protein
MFPLSSGPSTSSRQNSTARELGKVCLADRSSSFATTVKAILALIVILGLVGLRLYGKHKTPTEITLTSKVNEPIRYALSPSGHQGTLTLDQKATAPFSSPTRLDVYLTSIEGPVASWTVTKFSGTVSIMLEGGEISIDAKELEAQIIEN